MARAIDVANYFSQASNGRLSNLSLQKLVYLAHMFFAGKNSGKELIQDDKFEAWEYGPVSPKLYRSLTGFGSSAVPRIMFHGAIALAEEEKSTVEEVWKALQGASPGRLVQITHDPRGAWIRLYKPNVRGIEIPQEEILHEYERRAA